jgi:desulfoferrodoxin (superoxide reductase-like protein)
MIMRIWGFAFCVFALSSVASANKTSVALSGPTAAAAGTEVTITVAVVHRGNSARHHTEWVWIKADGKEIVRWDFNASRLPESESFSREVKITIAAPVEITAQGSCTLHGGKDPAVLTVGLK